MKTIRKKKPTISALEPRIMFDGAAVVTAVETLDNSSFTDSTNNDATDTTDVTSDGSTTFAPVAMEHGDVLILSSDLPGYEQLAVDMSTNYRVIVADVTSDAFGENITNALQSLDNEINVHIITTNQTHDRMFLGSYDKIDQFLQSFGDAQSTLDQLEGLSDYDLPQVTTDKTQIIVMDESVSYSQDLLDSIPKDAVIIRINSQEDGLTQLLSQLEGYSDLSTLHIFSHGNDGEIILGNTVLNAQTLSERSAELQQLGAHLAQDGDILLYGCDVGAGFLGENYVNLMAELTGADIAASDDATGSFIASADFHLETISGEIESSAISYDTNGTLLGSINNYAISVGRDSSRLTLQASGNGGTGWWSSNSNWVDFYTNNREVSYFGIKWVRVWFFDLPIPWINRYSYGTGVRYGTTNFTLEHDSEYSVTANIAHNYLENQLGGESGYPSAYGLVTYALYKDGFDKYNPLKNLVTASEGWTGSLIYHGELAAGNYTLVTSSDGFTWWPDIISLMTLNNYAEQEYLNGTLKVENHNHAPVWGAIADQVIDGAGEKTIVATTWSNVSDADGDEITLSAKIWNGSTETDLPSWLTFNPNTLTFSGNPPANTSPLTVRIKAFDEQEYGYKDFQLTFTNDNDRPIVANEIKDLTWDGEGSFSYQIPSATFTDADPDVDSFTYSAKLSDGSALPSWLSISSSGLISGNPPADFASLQIVVTANDGSGQATATQSDTFVLNLKNNNDIATVNDITITIDEDTTRIFSLADFVYTDTDTKSHADTASGTGKTIQSIRIVELPKNGVLWLDADSDGVLDSGETVQTNQIILASSISKLKYTPNANWAGHGTDLAPLDALITGPDSFKWVSSDSYDESSNVATTTLNVKLINDSPILSFSEGKTLNIRPNGGTALSAVYVDQGLNLIDPDAAYTHDALFDTIFGISVTIVDSTTNKFVTGDALSLTGSTSGFTVSYDSVNGILTIEKAGGTTATEYQTLLRTLQFSSTDTVNNTLRTLGLSFRTQDVGSKTSAYFDGVDDYIETMNASIPTSGDFTISAWTKLDNPENLAVGSYTIFGQGIGGSNIFLMINKNADNTYTLRVGDNWTITDISSLLGDGKWHQYTLTRSGSGSSDGSLYIDGKYMGSGDINTTITAGNGLRIGRLYDLTLNNAADYTGYWKGSISDIRIYNKALGALDIQKSLSNTLVGNESGLNAWYKLVSDYKNYATVSSDGGNAVVFKQADYGYSIKTGHYYKIDTTLRDYSNATSNAQGSTYAGENGYLLRLDDSLSASEIEVAKMLESLKAPESYWYWTGAERSYANGDWYWTAGPDSDVYFNHGLNEGLDNDPSYTDTVYTGDVGRFYNGPAYTPWITINNRQTIATFTFDALDSWDNESMYVYLNGAYLLSKSANTNVRETGTWNGSTVINGKTITWTIQAQGNWWNWYNSTGWYEQSYNITVNIPENFSSSFYFSFTDNLNEGAGNESTQIRSVNVITYNPDYPRDKAYMTSTGYIDNYLSSNQSYSVIEYGNRGEILAAPSLFATTNTALPDKYVNETRSITVRQTNNAPTATASWATSAINEDSQYTFTVANFTSKFSDTDGDTLSKIVVTSIPDSSKGELLLNGIVLTNNSEIPTGDLDKLIFKPATDYNGDVTFNYKGSDGYLLTNESVVTVRVNALNDAPVISTNQTLTRINEDVITVDNTGQSIASLISDAAITDADGTAVEAVAITSINNSYGSWQYKLSSGEWTNINSASGAIINLASNALLLDADSLVRFVPDANYNGTSSFSFRAWDKSTGTVGGTTDPYALGGNTSVSATVQTVTVTIDPVNDAPETLSKTITANEDSPYIFTTHDFKFSDVDENDLLESVIITSLPAVGVLKLSGTAVSLNQSISKADIENGSLTYLSAANEFGEAYSTFTFKVNDGDNDSLSATITFNIADTNDVPTSISWFSGGTVAESAVSVDGNIKVVGQLQATDPNSGDTLRFVQLSNNKFIIKPDGTVAIAISPKDADGNSVPLLDYELNTTETIRVKVIDSQGLTYERELSINVTDVEEKTPTLYTNTFYAQKGSTVTITTAYLNTMDADTSGTNLVYTVKQYPSGGMFFIDNNDNGTYDGGTDYVIAPENENTPENKATFTQQDILDGKIKFTKDNTQVSGKLSLEVSDGTTTKEGTLVAITSTPPVLSNAIDNQEWGISGAQSFSVPAATFFDADYDVLTLSAKLSNGQNLPSWLIFDPVTNRFSGTPVGMSDGNSISITITAGDGRTTPATDTFDIIFKATPTKPTITNPLPEYIEFIGSGSKSYAIPLDTFSDPHNSVLTYAASLGDGTALPSWLSFDASTKTFSGNPPASVIGGPIFLKITATNVTTDNVSTTLKLYVSDPNDIPVGPTLSNITIVDAVEHTYTVNKSNFSDGDSDLITLSLVMQDGSNLPGWIQASLDSSGNLSYKVTAPAGIGTIALRVIGSDGNGGEAASDFSLSYSGGVNKSPQVRTSTGISYMQGGILVTNPIGALESFSIVQGKTATITTDYLNENDPDDDGAGLTYTVANEPLYGQLWIDNDGDGKLNGIETALKAGDTFTQKDIDDRKLKYYNTDTNLAPTDDRFVFNLKDGGENSSIEVKGVSFNIDVLQAPAGVAPTLLSVSRFAPGSALTNADQLQFKVAFSDAVFNVDATDFSVTGSALNGASITHIENLGANKYLLTVTGVTDSTGTIGIALKDAGNTNIVGRGAVAVSQTAPSISEIYTLDNTKPSVTLSAQTLHGGSSSSFVATITFTEEIGSFTIDDITAVNATLYNLVKIDVTHYTVDVTPTNNSDITLDFNANGVEDSVGNLNTSATPITIVRNSLPTLSNINTSATYTEIDGTDTSVNDVSFSLAGISFADVNSSQGLQSFSVSIPTASILDGVKEELSVGSTVIPLNFTNGKAITNISIDSVEYKVTAIVSGSTSTLKFERATGVMSLVEAEALLDIIKYNNTSDEPTTTSTRVFSIVANDGLENSATSTVTVSVVATNDTPLISVASNNSAAASLDETNGVLSAQGTLSVVDRDTSNTASVSNVSVVSSGIITGLGSNNGAILAMLSVDTGNVIDASSTNGTITWSFNSGSEAFDYLAVGETLTLTYTLRVTDSVSATADQTVTVTVTGTNDVPKITGFTTSALDNTSSPITANGNIAFSDSDLIDRPTGTIIGAPTITLTGTTLSAAAVTAINDSFALPAVTGNTATGHLDWTFSLNPTLLKQSNATDYIPSGSKVVVEYSVRVDDAHGGTIDKAVKFTIVGSGTGGTLVVSGDAGSIVEGYKLSDAGSLTYEGQSSIASAQINSTVTITPMGVTLTVAQETAIKNAFAISIADNATIDAVNWTYAMTESTLNFLPKDASVQVVFTVDIYDNSTTPLNIGSKNVTIVINGTNDTPIVTSAIADARGSVIEAGNSVSGTATASDTLTSSDVDNSATASWSMGTTAGVYGNIAITSDGVWTYTLDDTKTATKALQTGDKKTETFVATVTDGTATAQQTILVEVNGTNDAPTLSTITAISYTDTSADNTFSAAVGILSSSDDDTGDTQTYSITNQVADTAQAGYTHSLAGTYGTLYINALTGGYTYIPDEAKMEATTGVVTDTFACNVADSLGVSITQTLTVNITGANDAPTVTIGSADSASKTMYETDSSLTASGTLSVADLDKAQSVTASVYSVSVDSAVATTSGTDLGWLSVAPSPVIDTGVTTGTLTWTFNSGSEAFNTLRQGETKTLVYTLHVSDGTATVDQVVTVTILGTDDAPIISINEGNSASGSVNESNAANLTTTGTLTVSDVEVGDSVAAIVDSVSVFSGSTASASVIPSNAALKAMLSLTPTAILDTTHDNATLTWTFNSVTQTFDALAASETLVLDYVIKVTDNATTPKMDTKVVRVTITGTNDAPIVSVVDITGAIQSGEPLYLSDSGSVAFGDVDFTNRPTAAKSLVSMIGQNKLNQAIALTPPQQTALNDAFTITAPSSNMNEGIVNWSYAVQQSTVDFLGAGEYVDAVFKITVSDGSLTDYKDVSVRITGRNNAPEILNGPGSTTLTETDSALSTTVNLDIRDTNITDTVTASVLSGTFKRNYNDFATMSDTQLGWLSITNSTVLGQTQTTATMPWVFNSGSEKFDYLDSSETMTLVYTVKVVDDNGEFSGTDTETITITIQGSNDTPLAVADSGSTSENSAVTIHVLSNDTDKDQSDIVSDFILLTGVNAPVITTDNHSTGYVSINVTTPASVSVVDNKLVFNPGDEFDYLATGESAEVVVTYAMSDNENAISTSTATITITGTNDTPTITVETDDRSSATHTETITPLVTSGTLSVYDIDTTNIVNAIVESVSIDGVVGTLSNPYFLSMMSLSSASIIDNGHNSGPINWSFDSASERFDFVAHEEILTLTYTIKVTDSSNGTDTQTVTITITGTNDAPTVDLVTDIYHKMSFGEKIQKETAFLFNDLDTTDRFIYSANFLPMGITIDPHSGLITGQANQSGIFTITIRATDPEGEAVERTFEMLVVAPPQPESSVNESTPRDNGGDIDVITYSFSEGQMVSNFDTVINDIITSEAVDRNQEGLSESFTLDMGVGGSFQENGLDLNNLELTSMSSNQGNGVNAKVIQVNADINFNNNGSLDYTEKTMSAFSTVGLTLETISTTDNDFEFKIIDSRAGQKYSVTLKDGSPLPAGYKFDPNTGLISVKISSNIKIIELSIKAFASDGTTRILNIKLDLDAMKSPKDLSKTEPTAFSTFKNQIKTEHTNMKHYGKYIESLFAKNIS